MLVQDFYSINILNLDPNQWPINYPTCGGERQSPIDLDVVTAIETEYPTLSFGNYNKVIPVESLTNNGHTSN